MKNIAKVSYDKCKKKSAASMSHCVMPLFPSGVAYILHIIFYVFLIGQPSFLGIVRPIE
jgi:hypothetical protein